MNKDNFKEIISSVIFDSEIINELEKMISITNLNRSVEAIKFLTKTMIYSRYNDNNIAFLIGIILADNVKNTNYLRPALRKLFLEPQDLIYMLNLWNTKKPGKMIPNVLRRAFKDAIENNFSDEQLTQYNESDFNSKVKLKDVIKIAHPGKNKYVNNNFNLQLKKYNLLSKKQIIEEIESILL